MPNAENQDEQAVVLDLADKPVVADAVFPEFPEAGAVQSLADAAGVIQPGYSFRKELQNAPPGVS